MQKDPQSGHVMNPKKVLGMLMHLVAEWDHSSPDQHEISRDSYSKPTVLIG